MLNRSRALALVLFYRSVVQLVERRSPKPNVGGSSPSWPANFFKKKLDAGSTGHIISREFYDEYKNVE